MEPKKRITMTPLERNLLEDHSGAYRKNLLQKILQQRQELESLMQKGLSPNEYKAWYEFKQAIDSALELIKNFK